MPPSDHFGRHNDHLTSHRSSGAARRTPGREAIQTIVSIAQGVTAPRHSHPGEEVIYVLEGVLEYQLDGQPPVTLKAGDVLFIPAGVVHSAKNVGSGNAAELATYIVEKGKPLVMLGEANAQ